MKLNFAEIYKACEPIYNELYWEAISLENIYMGIGGLVVMGISITILVFSKGFYKYYYTFRIAFMIIPMAGFFIFESVASIIKIETGAAQDAIKGTIVRKEIIEEDHYIILSVEKVTRFDKSGDSKDITKEYFNVANVVHNLVIGMKLKLQFKKNKHMLIFQVRRALYSQVKAGKAITLFYDSSAFKGYAFQDSSGFHIPIFKGSSLSSDYDNFPSKKILRLIDWQESFE